MHADRYLGVAADKGVGVGYSKPMKQAYQRAEHIAFQLWTRRFEIEIRLNPTFVLNAFCLDLEECSFCEKEWSGVQVGLVGLRHKGQTWNNLGRCGLLNPLSQCCIQYEEELGEPAVQAPQIATAPKVKKWR